MTKNRYLQKLLEADKAYFVAYDACGASRDPADKRKLNDLLKAYNEAAALYVDNGGELPLDPDLVQVSTEGAPEPNQNHRKPRSRRVKKPAPPHPFY